jgi:hypothetical protein
VEGGARSRARGGRAARLARPKAVEPGAGPDLRARGGHSGRGDGVTAAGGAGGEGGIRTPGTLAGTPDFESGPFNQAPAPLRGAAEATGPTGAGPERRGRLRLGQAALRAARAGALRSPAHRLRRVDAMPGRSDPRAWWVGDVDDAGPSRSGALERHLSAKRHPLGALPAARGAGVGHAWRRSGSAASGTRVATRSMRGGRFTSSSPTDRSIGRAGRRGGVRRPRMAAHGRAWDWEVDHDGSGAPRSRRTPPLARQDAPGRGAGAP